ncbi:MAG: hypothetical protein ABI169_10620 [Chitinophagaceae bacterium]
MKNLILIAGAFFWCFQSFAGGKDKPVDLTGDWKEVQRNSLLKDKVDYIDTTYYHFLIGNEYTVQRKNSYMYRGTYKTEGGKLDLGMRAYSIASMKPNEMVLKDNDGTYFFVRYDGDAARAENNDAASSSSRGHQESISPENLSPEQLSGRWEVYKRTSSEKLPDIDYTKIIRVIDFKMENGNASGGVESAKDMNGAPSWKITGFKDDVISCTGKTNRELKVLKCEGSEMIVQEGTLTYFFKKFK